MPYEKPPVDGLFVAKQFITVHSRSIPVRLLTVTRKPLKLEKSQKMANIETLDGEGMEVLPWPDDEAASEYGAAKVGSVSAQVITDPEKFIEEMKSKHKWVNELHIGKLSLEQKALLYQVLVRYHHVFSKHENDIGRTELKPATIQLDTTVPINVRPYPQSPENLATLKRRCKS